MVQMSTAVRNARLDAIETAIGTAPTLEVRTGAAPGTTALADTGTLLALINLPSDWLAAAASGQKALSGTWQDLIADNSGTPGHYRIKQGATTHLQGTASGPGGGGELLFDTATFTAGQQVNVTSYTITEPHA